MQVSNTDLKIKKLTLHRSVNEIAAVFRFRNTGKLNQIILTFIKNKSDPANERNSFFDRTTLPKLRLIFFRKCFFQAWVTDIKIQALNTAFKNSQQKGLRIITVKPNQPVSRAGFIKRIYREAELERKILMIKHGFSPDHSPVRQFKRF